MPEQSRLHMIRPQSLAQKRVVEQIDLADREVVGCPPPAVDPLELRAVEGVGRLAHVRSLGWPLPATPDRRLRAVDIECDGEYEPRRLSLRSACSGHASSPGGRRGVVAGFAR